MKNIEETSVLSTLRTVGHVPEAKYENFTEFLKATIDRADGLTWQTKNKHRHYYNVLKASLAIILEEEPGERRDARQSSISQLIELIENFQDNILSGSRKPFKYEWLDDTVNNLHRLMIDDLTRVEKNQDVSVYRFKAEVARILSQYQSDEDFGKKNVSLFRNTYEVMQKSAYDTISKMYTLLVAGVANPDEVIDTSNMLMYRCNGIRQYSSSISNQERRYADCLQDTEIPSEKVSEARQELNKRINIAFGLVDEVESLLDLGYDIITGENGDLEG